MNPTVTRNYKKKDIEMLTAIEVIIDNAIANKAFLQSKRSTWADPFFDNIKTQIQSTADTHLGRDAARNMRLASQTVYTIQATALTNLSELKIQIEQDYKQQPTDKTEILTNLGFTTYHKQSQNGDQEALVNQLFQYKTNLTPTLKTELIAKGIAETTLDAITAQAQSLKDANISQETFKGTRKEITNEVITAFNAIYDTVISIANISKNFYKTDPIKKQQFSFTKITANLNSQTNTTTTNKK